MISEVKVFAPGTVANVGPGFDCLGFALDTLGDFVTVRAAPKGQDNIVVTGRDCIELPREFEKNCVGIVANAIRKSFQFSPTSLPLEIEIERSLPLSGGLGASAASSVGAALATATFMHRQGLCPLPTSEQLIEWALVGEEAVAGRHLDNIAPCVLGGMTLSFFVEGQPLVRTFDPLGNFYVSLVTPRVRIETKAARGVLPKVIDQSVYLEGIAKVAGVTLAMLTGDAALLGKCLDDPYAVPHRSKGIPHFEQAFAAARSAGALGFSISGSGPTLFAFTASLDAAQDVLEAVAAVYLKMGASSHICRIGVGGAGGARVLGKG